MKLCSVLAVCVCAFGAAAADRSLLEVRNIYLLPMGGGLDQHIATRIAQEGRYTVVTDAALADAILTDNIGETFEGRMQELYPPPPPPPSSAAEEEKKADRKRTDEPRLGDVLSQNAVPRMRTTSFSRSRGNVYLVDRQSKQVLWSTWLRPSGSRPQELHRAAGEIADRLDDSARQVQKRVAKSGGVAPAAAPPVPAPSPTVTSTPATAPPAPAPATPAVAPAATPAPAPAPAPAK